MPVINTNVNALFSQNALKVNSRNLTNAMEQLSTGKQINSAKDDAAGLAITNTMTSYIRGLSQAVRNANDGINMLQTAEGAMIEQTNMLQRMRELAVQATTASNNSTQIGYLDLEFQALDNQINTIATTTKWNGSVLLYGSAGDGATTSKALSFIVGAAGTETITVSLANTSTAATSGLATTALAVSSALSAVAAITAIDLALGSINTARASIGAGINQLTYAADNLSNVIQNTTASRSQILDTDYAVATTKLASAQIIAQAATAMLAQANQSQQSVLALLK
jgi:flagellin